MVKPLSSCYKSDPIRTNSVLKFSNGESRKWENGKNALSSNLCCCGVTKIFSHLLSPLLLLRVLWGCQEWGWNPGNLGVQQERALDVLLIENWEHCWLHLHKKVNLRTEILVWAFLLRPVSEKRAFSAGWELAAELWVACTHINTHTSKKLGGKNSDEINILWHGCCCGNQAWQCVRQVNFRESKLFFKTVGETDGFCLRMDS